MFNLPMEICPAFSFPPPNKNVYHTSPTSHSLLFLLHPFHSCCQSTNLDLPTLSSLSNNCVLLNTTQFPLLTVLHTLMSVQPWTTLFSPTTVWHQTHYSVSPTYCSCHTHSSLIVSPPAKDYPQTLLRSHNILFLTAILLPQVTCLLYTSLLPPPPPQLGCTIKHK